MKQSVLALMLLLCAGFVSLRAQSIPEIERLIDQGQYVKARTAVDKLIAADPKSERLHYLSGTIYLKSEEYPQAKSTFERGINMARNYPWNYIGLGSVLVTMDYASEAKAKLTEAQNLNKNNDSKILLGIADAYLLSTKREYTKEAEIILTKLIASEPNNVDANIALGDLYDRQNVDDLALTYYEKAITLNPNFMKGWLRVGQIKKKKKDYPGAAAAFQKAIDIDPKFPPSYRELGSMWFLAGQIPQAKQNFEKYLELVENDPLAKIEYGKVCFTAKDYDCAIAQFENAAKDTVTIVMSRLLGYSYAEKGDAAKAEGAMQDYFKRVPEAKIITSDYDYSARINKLKGLDSLAILEYWKAIEMGKSRNEDVRPYYDAIAEIYKAAKRYDKQAEVMEKMLDGKYTSMKDVFGLGRAYYFAKNYMKADEMFTKVTEINATFPGGWAWKAKATAQMDPGNAEWKAKPFYEKVLEVVKPEEKDKYKDDLLLANRYLGAHYTAANNCKSAAPYWDAALLLDPNDATAKQGRDYCNQNK
jgi:tetratricopeptide (TPR) repeat protein